MCNPCYWMLTHLKIANICTVFISKWTLEGDELITTKKCCRLEWLTSVARYSQLQGFLSVNRNAKKRKFSVLGPLSSVSLHRDSRGKFHNNNNNFLGPCCPNYPKFKFNLTFLWSQNHLSILFCSSFIIFLSITQSTSSPKKTTNDFKKTKIKSIGFCFLLSISPSLKRTF